MRVHHLNCGTMCPLGGALMYGAERPAELRHLVCHCQLVETDAHGLVLVDTGIGLRDVRQPNGRLSAFFRYANRIQLREGETALRQVEALGFRAGDVRHIVLTHLDFDHAGGIEDFPGATVHVLADELAAARGERTGFIARNRYSPPQWDEGVRWREYRAPEGEPWFGFESVRGLDGLPPEILMIPLRGHTRGHCGVALDTGRGWLLNAGDAYFHEREMGAGAPGCPPGLRGYQRIMEADREARLRNQDRLRGLARERGGEVGVFCSHDAAELARLRAGASAAAAADAARPASLAPAGGAGA
jgi:glyoxylase-like metal-dependent hydrolase (beta-lactamase superfamily II)